LQISIGSGCPGNHEIKVIFIGDRRHTPVFYQKQPIILLWEENLEKSNP
jgi:hypothetical protein